MTPEEILEQSAKQATGSGLQRSDVVFEWGATVIEYLQNCDKNWVDAKQIHQNTEIEREQLPYTTQTLSQMGLIEKWGGKNSNWGLTEKGKHTTPEDIT